MIMLLACENVVGREMCAVLSVFPFSPTVKFLRAHEAF